MKLKSLLTMLFFVMLVCGAATAANAQSDSEQKPNTTDKQKDDDKDDDDDDEDESPEAQARLMKEAKITIEQARITALERVKGTIVEEEIERENGRLIYSFEIRDADKKLSEVEIDAMTGALIGVEQEDDDNDDDGKKADKPRDPAENI